jgi:large subunit ribosomal protein L32
MLLFVYLLFTIYDLPTGVIMPNPKRRHSKARRGKRRAHDALRVPQTSLCPNCQEPRLQHRVCPKCGYYKDRQVVRVEQT